MNELPVLKLSQPSNGYYILFFSMATLQQPQPLCLVRNGLIPNLGHVTLSSFFLWQSLSLYTDKMLKKAFLAATKFSLLKNNNYKTHTPISLCPFFFQLFPNLVLNIIFF